MIAPTQQPARRFRPIQPQPAPVPPQPAMRPITPQSNAMAPSPQGADTSVAQPNGPTGGAPPIPPAQPIHAAGPATPPPVALPPTSSAPDGNLQNAVILPGGDDRLRGIQDASDSALAGLGGPNRTDLARTALADFDQRGEQALAGRFRKVGQTAAKFGRIGLGDVNQELGSIQGDYERDRMGFQNELARSVSEGDINDRFRRVAATGSLEDRVFGQGRDNRDEHRDERGYQQDRDQRTLDNQVNRRKLENEEKEAEWRKAAYQLNAGG